MAPVSRHTIDLAQAGSERDVSASSNSEDGATASTISSTHSAQDQSGTSKRKRASSGATSLASTSGLDDNGRLESAGAHPPPARRAKKAAPVKN